MKRLVIVLSLLFLFPSLVSAQNEEQISEAREHFARAQIAFQQERWLDCATHFESSFQTIFAPELLYNIGLCYERAASTLLGAEAIPYMERAVAAYGRYLREVPQATDSSAVQVRLRDLRTLIERVRASLVPLEDPEPLPAEVEPDPEPRVMYPPTGDITIVGDPAITILGNSARNVPTRDFGFVWTSIGGGFTVVSFITAVGLSFVAQTQFNNLANGCGSTTGGCMPSDVGGLVDLATGANVLYALSGVLLAATGVAFGLEFHLWTTPNETSASMDYTYQF